MSLLFNLSIIGMVLTFLVGVLMSFPGQPSEAEGQASAGEQFDIGKINEIAELFTGSYISVVDDISVHQSTPDFGTADAKREEMSAYGNSLVGEFDGFQEMMMEQLEQLELPTPEPTSTPTP